MTWLQLKLATTRDDTEALEDALLAAGAVSVTLQDNADQPILEPGVNETPLWDQVKLTGLFNADINTQQTTALAEQSFGGKLPNTRWEQLEDKDWERTWMDNYHPIQCGERLWICPSWLEPPQAEAVNLMLDPGLAFGTGTHPTTFLCLQWLERQDLKGKTVLDYGCGSGILGIAALLLGAEKVVAVDNDPQALIATKDNLNRNKLNEAQLETYLPEETPEIVADILIANILAAPLISLAPTLKQHLQENAPICLSGILSHQASDVAQAYEPEYPLTASGERENWIRLCNSGT
ncbi:MAG: 50S ribosomal protein L11 methyltransferase [Cellvibrionaceae bacterium]